MDTISVFITKRNTKQRTKSNVTEGIQGHVQNDKKRPKTIVRS